MIDPTAPGGGLSIADSIVEANVVAGQTYYIRAASAGEQATRVGRTATGDVSPFAHVSGLRFWRDIRRCPHHPATRARTLDAGGRHSRRLAKWTCFSLRPPRRARSRSTSEQTPAIGTVVDPIVVAYDAQGNEIARGAVRLTIGVQTGSLYFVQVGGYGASTGGFQFTYSEVRRQCRRSSTLVPRSPSSISRLGSATESGVLGAAGDVNVFQFVATVSGQATVTLATPL